MSRDQFGEFVHGYWDLKGLMKLPSYPLFSCLVVCSHQALSKNGKVYGTDIMVGVVPCIEKVGISHVYFAGILLNLH